MKLLSMLALSFAALSAHQVNADQWLVRAGATTVQPNASSSFIAIDGAATDSKVDVDSNTQLGLTVTYMLQENWGVELLAATPFSHRVTAKGGALNGVRVGDAEHLPPTLSAVYYFSNGAFRPYLGLGVNYTTFFSESVDAELEGVLGDSKLTLKDSWGFAAQLGADYNFNDKWQLNASVRYIDIKTDAKITNGTSLVTTEVDIDPYVYSLMVGYRF